MSDISQAALERASQSSLTFAKFLSPNDTGLTGGHQCGIYIPQNSAEILFDDTFARGENHERRARIIWNEGQWDKESRFVYYGRKTRNEYRITHFGKGFPFLAPVNTGDLFALCKTEEDLYHAFVLASDDDIQDFLDSLSLAPTELNRIVSRSDQAPSSEEELFESYYVQFKGDFPSTQIMARAAEETAEAIGGEDFRSLKADEKLIRLVDTEYRLFRFVEQQHYEYVTLEPAESLESFVKTSLEIINRRKARAGKSLEYHLGSIFKERRIRFTSQPKTENGKTPDFIFPSEEAYNDLAFPTDSLTFLAAKTTCKDRWRQILDEADRIQMKYLFTLQQGMSPNQLRQMREANVTLVVPAPYHGQYPKVAGGAEIISLEDFISLVLSKQRPLCDNAPLERAREEERTARQ